MSHVTKPYVVHGAELVEDLVVGLIQIEIFTFMTSQMVVILVYTYMQ